jgi:hypothetical protein
MALLLGGEGGLGKLLLLGLGIADGLLDFHELALSLDLGLGALAGELSLVLLLPLPELNLKLHGLALGLDLLLLHLCHLAGGLELGLEDFALGLRLGGNALTLSLFNLATSLGLGTRKDRSAARSVGRFGRWGQPDANAAGTLTLDLMLLARTLALLAALLFATVLLILLHRNGSNGLACLGGKNSDFGSTIVAVCGSRGLV